MKIPQKWMHNLIVMVIIVCDDEHEWMSIVIYLFHGFIYFRYNLQKQFIFVLLLFAFIWSISHLDFQNLRRIPMVLVNVIQEVFIFNLQKFVFPLSNNNIFCVYYMVSWCSKLLSQIYCYKKILGIGIFENIMLSCNQFRGIKLFVGN